jgi:hypothetical protein
MPLVLLLVIVAWVVGAPGAAYLAWTAWRDRGSASTLTAEGGAMVFVAVVIVVALIGITIRYLPR